MTLETWVQTPAARALGWTLVHSLWQGAAAAAALACVLAATRSSRVRYAAACLALAGMLAAGGVTFARLNAQPETRSSPAARALVLPQAPRGITAPGPIPAPWPAEDVLPWLAPFWLAGVCLFQVRGLAGWMMARRLRRTGVCCAPVDWQGLCARLAAQMRVRRPVLLLESCLSEAPVVVGWLRPVILLPLGMLAGLPPAQVELILLHELAHVRRYDNLVNLLQAFAEGLLFYHPAAWWISRVIRAERENCCDDLVMAAGGSAREYATALTALAESRLAFESAMAATGGSLARRVRRLLYPAEGPRISLAPVLWTVLLAVGAAGLSGWQAAPPAPSPAYKAAETRLRAELAKPYRKWLEEDVIYLVTDGERAEFQNLQTDAQREAFVESFWTRRDPTPGTPENEFKVEHYRRIAYANERFASGIPGWKSDRGKTYIIFGPPDERETHPGGATGTPETAPFEIWRYGYIEGVGRDVTFTFVDRARTGEYLWVEKQVGNSRAAVDTFSSVEPGTHARVTVIYPQRLVTITIPVDFKAESYRIYGRISTASRLMVNVFEDTVECADAPGLSECPEGSAYTKWLGLVPGDLVLHAVVKAPSGTPLKTYTVNFTVK